jgi:hypothetical protein
VGRKNDKDDAGNYMSNNRQPNVLGEIAVTAQDLATALNAVANLSEEERKDFTGRTVAVMRAFGLLKNRGTQKGLTDNDRAKIETVTVVQCRLEALAKISRHERFKMWSADSGINDGAVIIREDMLRAVAETRLYEEPGKGPCFDADEFFNLLLAVAEEEGKA